ncbi:MAG: hypothetical protein K5637_00520 [Lachnospiraceae bacterium]|nr:hypothetical protein [Lachnospiraceae bacterium]
MQWFLIILLAAVIFAAAFYYQKKKIDQLAAEGKIIRRSGLFYEESEIFETSANYEDLRAIFSRLDLSEMKVTYYPDLEGSRTLLFKSGYAWNASLKDMGSKDGKNVLKFSFPAWDEKNGQVHNINSMNMMVTQVEKAILSLDPNAMVENHKMQLKTKTKLF